jgi:copper chaperone CopZ
MKGKIITTLLVLASLGLVLTLASRVRVLSVAEPVAVLAVSGMTCGSCAERITGALSREAGVGAAHVDIAAGTVAVAFDPAQTSPEQLARAVSAQGYPGLPRQVLSGEEYRRTSGAVVATRRGCCGTGGGCASGPSR